MKKQTQQQNISLSYLVIPKAEILATADYNLTASRYRKDEAMSNSKWKMVELGEVCSFENGKAHEQYINEYGKYKVINSKFVSSEGREYKCSDKCILPLKYKDVVMVMSDVPNGKTIAKCFFVDKDDTYTLNQRVGLFRPKEFKKLIPEFLFLQLNRNEQLLKYDNGQSQTNLRKEDILSIKLFIPPLSVQEEIVREIENIQKMIQENKKLIEIFEGKIREVIGKVYKE